MNQKKGKNSTRFLMHFWLSFISISSSIRHLNVLEVCFEREDCCQRPKELHLSRDTEIYPVVFLHNRHPNVDVITIKIG